LQTASFSTEVVASLQLFANAIISCLQTNHHFQLVSWRGDGGIFAHDSDNLPNLDFAIPAAEAVAKLFYEWRSQDISRSVMGFRISLHDGAIYIHDNPGLWLSRDLSTFAKYERDIGLGDAIAITGQVREHLSKAIGASFSDSALLKRHLGENANGDALIKFVYYRSLSSVKEIHMSTEMPQDSLYSLIAKLSQQTGQQTAADAKIGPQSSVRASLGSTVMLYSISRPTAQLTIGLQPTKQETKYALTEDEQALLNNMARENAQKSAEAHMPDNLKISPDRVTFPLTDVPYLIIHWHPERWSVARSFHTLVDKRPDMYYRLAKSAADVQELGLPFPSILCMHVIVRIASDEGDERRYVLLCQRNVRGHEGHYHEGKWSCSIEENSKPNEEILTSIRRGVAEELLGENAYDYITAKPIATFLETPFLNLTVLATASVPLRFHEIVNRWKIEATDKDEHRQIIAFPLEWDAIVECGKCGQLTPDVRELCLKSDEELFQNTTLWDFHPTALLRLAAAFWLESDCTSSDNSDICR